MLTESDKKNSKGTAAQIYKITLTHTELFAISLLQTQDLFCLLVSRLLIWHLISYSQNNSMKEGRTSFEKYLDKSVLGEWELEEDLSVRIA